jgi:hypothetical protein
VPLPDPLLSPVEMAEFRSLAFDIGGWQDHYRVVRTVRTSDNAGGWINTEQTVAEGYGLLRDPGAGNERETEIAGRLGWTKFAIFDVSIYDAVGLPLDIRPTDRLVINGVEHETAGEPATSGYYTTQRSVIVRETE